MLNIHVKTLKMMVISQTPILLLNVLLKNNVSINGLVVPNETITTAFFQVTFTDNIISNATK